MKLLASLADHASGGWRLCAVAGSRSGARALAVWWHMVSPHGSEGFALLSPGILALDPVVLELRLERARLDLGIATALLYCSFQ